MYTTLAKTIKDLGIKKKYLSKEILRFNGQQSLSNRLSGKVDFSEQERKSIYEFLCSKGYEGSIEELFSVEPSIKYESRFSQILREEMRKKKMTIEKLQEQLETEENIKVSTVTISNWRNGKIEGYPKHNICIALCKILDISTEYFFNDNHTYQFEGGIYEKQYENTGYVESSLDRETSVYRHRLSSIVKQLVDYTLEDQDVASYKKAIKDYRARKIVYEVAENMISQFLFFLSRSMFESNEYLEPCNEDYVINDMDFVSYHYEDENGVWAEKRRDIDLIRDLENQKGKFHKVINDKQKMPPITLHGYEWGIAEYLHEQRERLTPILKELKKKGVWNEEDGLY